MARPPKTGLEYFSLDVDIAEDEKILYLESETGLEGFAVYVKLLATIYRSGYYIMWTETQLGIYSRKFFVDKNTLSAVVSVCNNIGLFDKNLFEKYRILTSHGIQTRYLLASERRSSVSMIEEFCLLDSEQTAKNKKIKLIPAPKQVFTDKNTMSAVVSVCNNSPDAGFISAETPQSKVKKSNVVVVTRARARDIEEGNTSEVFTAFSNNIHPLTGEIEADTLGDLLDHYGKEWVLEAIKEAAKNHGTSVKYIEAILQAWERNGFKAPKKGRGNRNGRYIQGNSGAHREEPEGLRKLKEDMAYADAHTVHPWDVQPDGGGDGAEPGKDSGVRGRAGTM